MRKSKSIDFVCIFLLMLLLINCGRKNNISILQIKKIDNYPSASSIEYIDGKLYLMGDDATNFLVLDTNLNIIDSIPIISIPARRIPKETKPDLEASAFNIDSNEIFLFGSGSLSPYRNLGWKYNLKTRENDSINLEPLYLKANGAGIKEINVEGACFVSGKLILVTRGNKGYPHNHFIITDQKLWENDSNLQIRVVPFLIGDYSSFRGISGLCYAKESDKLIMTVSTEDTKNSYDDGTIGKSYLWIIDKISTKLNDTIIDRNRVIDLEFIDSRFKGQKIESATVIGETNKLIHLVLVADNDDGSSTVFKMSITKVVSLAE